MKLSIKRLFLVILIFALIIALIVIIVKKAGSKEKEKAPKKTKTVSSEETKTPEPPKVPTSPLGLYVEENKVYKKYDTIKFKWPTSDNDSLWQTDTWTVPGQSHLIHDIACFTLVPSADSEVSIKKYNPDWLQYWQQYYSDEHKIGYEFNVKLKSGETKHFTVKQTSDTMKLSDYFELYLYDDFYHSNGGFYSHTTQDEFESRDNVLNTSIKITLCNKCYDIEKIELTGFVYSGDNDFDKDGFYNGADKVTCTIFTE